MTTTDTVLHASCVAYGNRGILIRGGSGTGKSTLALELITLGAKLVADDGAILSVRDDMLIAQCPKAIRSIIEARGIGLLSAPAQKSAAITLIVDLDQPEPDRLPPRRTITILGVEVDLVFGKDAPTLAPALNLLMQGGRVA